MNDEAKHTWDKVNSWAEELDLLKSIIAKTSLVETRKWGGDVYTHNGKNIIGIGGFKNYFTIWFFNGVFLKDEAQVLVNAQEGVTKALRQWRFYNQNEVNENLVLAYIAEAIANEEKGLVHKPEKKATVISGFLHHQLAEDGLLKAHFDKLTPYKQREYMEYIDTAKREETKIARMQKIKPMIMADKGLNDQYK